MSTYECNHVLKEIDSAGRAGIFKCVLCGRTISGTSEQVKKYRMMPTARENGFPRVLYIFLTSIFVVVSLVLVALMCPGIRGYMKSLLLHIFESICVLILGLVFCAFGGFFVRTADKSFRRGYDWSRGFGIRSVKIDRSTHPIQFWLNVSSIFVVGLLFITFGICVIIFPKFFFQ